jgi:hypothetical protein
VAVAAFLTVTTLTAAAFLAATAAFVTTALAVAAFVAAALTMAAFVATAFVPAAFFAFVAVTVAILTVAFTVIARRFVLMKAGAPAAAPAIAAAGQCQRAAGAEREKSDCQECRQALLHERSLVS